MRISSNVVISGMGFISSIFVIKYFGVEVAGTIAFYLSILVLFSCVCDVGLSNALIKFIAEEQCENRITISTFFLLKFILLCIYIFICIIYIFYINKKLDDNLLVIFLISNIVNHGIRSPLFHLFKAKRDFKLLSIAEVSSSLILFAYTVIICLYFQNIYLLAMKVLFLNIIEAIFLIVFLIKKKVNYFVMPDSRNIKKFINYAAPIALTTFISNVMSQIDNVLLGNILGMKELGLYDIAKRLFSPVDIVIKAVTTTLYPEILNRMYSNKHFFYTDFKQIVQLLTCFGSIIAFFIIFLSKPFVTLIYGIENVNAASILIFFSGVCVAKLLFRPYHHLIYGLELQKIFLYITPFANLFKLLCYIYFIPRIGAITFPIIFTLTWLFPGGIVVWNTIRKHYGKTHIAEIALKILFPFCVIIFISYIFNFSIYIFPIVIFFFITIQVQLQIITNRKMSMILSPITTLFSTKNS